jgi:hypothetical protein
MALIKWRYWKPFTLHRTMSPTFRFLAFTGTTVQSCPDSIFPNMELPPAGTEPSRRVSASQYMAWPSPCGDDGTELFSRRIVLTCGRRRHRYSAELRGPVGAAVRWAWFGQLRGKLAGRSWPWYDVLGFLPRENVACPGGLKSIWIQQKGKHHETHRR